MRARFLLIPAVGMLGAACSLLFPFEGLEGAPNDAGASADVGSDALIDAGPCPDGGSPCNGQCLNLKTDPKNCGTCGLVCVDPTCNAGFCATLGIAGERGAPDNIVVEGTLVSWMVRTPDATKIFHADLAAPDAGASRRISAIPLPAVYDLAVTQSGYLYRTTQAIYVLPKDAKDAGTATAVFTAGLGETIAGFAATDLGADTRITYLIARAGESMFTGYRIVIGAAPSGPVQRFVADLGPDKSARYFWTNGDDLFFFLVGLDSEATLLRATNAFGGPASDVTAIAVGETRPTGLSGDDAGTLAWTASGVITASRTGATRRLLVRGGPNDRFSQLALDDREIYYLSPGNSTLRRVSRDGSAPVAVGVADDEPSSVTLTPDYALWLRLGNLYALRRR